MPDNKHKIRVWIKIINPNDKGWFKKIKKNEIVIKYKVKNVLIISKNSLIKIIILEIIDKVNLFLWWI